MVAGLIQISPATWQAIGDCPANDTHRKTHVSTDELFTQSKALPICIKEGRTVARKGHTQKRDVLADPIIQQQGSYKAYQQHHA